MTTSDGKKFSVNYYVVINFYHIYYLVGTKKQKVQNISIALILQDSKDSYLNVCINMLVLCRI